MTDVEDRLRAALRYRGEHVTPDTLQQPQLRPHPRRPPRVLPALAAAACVLAIATAGVITYAVTGHHRTGVGPPAAASTPMQMCQAALNHKTINSAAASTVGEVRALSGGPPPGPKLDPSAFPGAQSSAPAAWCWVRNGAHSWTAYAVGPGHQSIRVTSYTGITITPTGAPAIK